MDTFCVVAYFLLIAFIFYTFHATTWKGRTYNNFPPTTRAKVFMRMGV